jgi:hypothetical protein
MPLIIVEGTDISARIFRIYGRNRRGSLRNEKYLQFR